MSDSPEQPKVTSISRWNAELKAELIREGKLWWPGKDASRSDRDLVGHADSRTNDFERMEKRLDKIFTEAEKNQVAVNKSEVIKEMSAIQESNRAADFIRTRHVHYARLARTYNVMYYSFRILAGISAALLPFFVNSNLAIATGLSVVVAVVTVFDLVFEPAKNRAIYRAASLQLTKARLSRTGEYQLHKEAMKVIEKLENRAVADPVTLDGVISPE